MIYVGIIYLVINIVAIIIMDIDKKKAISGKERIPEVHLFLTAVLFGAFGVLIAMYLLRHKIRKWYFHVGALMIIIQNCCTIYVFLKLLKII